jgi:hypothetical protein
MAARETMAKEALQGLDSRSTFFVRLHLIRMRRPADVSRHFRAAWLFAFIGVVETR